jgi:hypothetical protein
MTSKENVVRGHLNTEHFVQLFDDSESLGAAVASFLEEGFSNGDAALVVLSRDHWDAIAARLHEHGVSIAAAAASGQLTIRDGAEMLHVFTQCDLPDAELFDRSIGTLVRQLAAGGRRLRIYGEMVDLLAAEGNFRGASALEQLWNELGERESFTLFCSYSAVHFGDPRTTDALRAICRFHSHVRSSPVDILGSFLLKPHLQQRRATDAGL